MTQPNRIVETFIPADTNRPGVMIVELGVDVTDDELLDIMKRMKAGREEGVFSEVVCGFRGFDDDRREIHQIPEVRACCLRLVESGFISYLTVLTMLNPKKEKQELLGGALGAAEVWLISQDLMAPEVGVSPQLAERIQRVIAVANAKADAVLGPMKR